MATSSPILMPFGMANESDPAKGFFKMLLIFFRRRKV